MYCMVNDAAQVAQAIGRLGVSVQRRHVLRLLDIIASYAIPSWHPCPCSHTHEERAVAMKHIEDVAESGGRLLMPVLVGTVAGKSVIFAPTCLIEAALAMRNHYEGDVLRRVSAEVWDLGDFGVRTYLAKALAALLCIVYIGRRSSEVNMSFIEDFLRYKVVELAGESRDEAIRFIDRLERRVDIADVVKELTEIIDLSEKTIYRYLQSIVNEEFVSELRRLVGVSNDVLETMESVGKPQDRLGVKASFALTSISRALNMSMNDLRPLTIISGSKLEGLAKVVNTLVREGRGEEARGIIAKVEDLINEGFFDRAIEYIEEVTSGITESAQDQRLAQAAPTQAASTIVEAEQSGESNEVEGDREFLVRIPCVKDDCRLLRSLAKAADKVGKFAAVINLLILYARELGYGELAELLEGLVMVEGDSVMVDRGLVRALGNVYTAYRRGDLAAMCDEVNKLIVRVYEGLDAPIKEALRSRGFGTGVDCSRLPSVDDVAEVSQVLKGGV